VNGLLVRPGDAAAFAAAADRLVRDERWRRALAASGRDRAREFGVEQMVEGVERVYEKVLSTAPSAASSAAP
jgi:glycosyltransferase involved in cell wall biosynthesis